MKKIKTKWIISLFVIIAAAALIATAVSAVEGGFSESSEFSMFSLGKYLREGKEKHDRETSKKSKSDTDIIARYKEYDIYRSQIEYTRNVGLMNSADNAEKYAIDRDVANRIIENIMLGEEAERRGLSATEEEIEAMLNSAREAYEMPEGKEMLDQYCAGAGITIDEYYEDLLEKAPRIIARNKLLNEISENTMEDIRKKMEDNGEKGLDPATINVMEMVQEAQDKFLAELLEAGKDDITYFVD